MTAFQKTGVFGGDEKCQVEKRQTDKQLTSPELLKKKKKSLKTDI